MQFKRQAALALVAAAAWGVMAPATQAASVNVVELTAADIEAGLQAGTFTVTDLVQSYLDRINTYEPYYNAFTWLNPDVLAQAAAVDAQIQANGVTLPLQGVPVVIKDSMDVAGVRTTSGYSGFVSELGGADMIPDKDAPVVARLKAAGAIIIGKTNLPAFARSGNNANTSFDGPTYNSYNRALIPGGSSSGTATATSASFTTLGMAEETGGSIQNPAGAQSLVGVKPTFGLVPTSGGVPLAGATRDVFGPIAKTVHDAAVTLDVLAGYDPSDPKTAASNGNIPSGGYAAGLSTTSLEGKRIGLFGTGFKNVTVSPETQALYNNAVAVLQAQGATVVSDPFAGTNFTSLGATFSSLGSLSLPYDINQWMANLGPSSPHSTAEFKARTGIDLLAPGGPLISSTTNPAMLAAIADPTVMPDISGFFTGRDQMLALFNKVMDDNNLDALFFPQMYDKLPTMESGAGYRNTTVSEINLLGTPAVDLSGGYYSDGSPFAVQFLGKQWSEGDLLSFAYDFEQATLYRTAPNLVPEPATLGLLALGGLTLLRRRRVA